MLTGNAYHSAHQVPSFFGITIAVIFLDNFSLRIYFGTFSISHYDYKTVSEVIKKNNSSPKSLKFLQKMNI